MSIEVSEMERKDNELALRRIEGKPQHIKINERTISAYKQEYAKKGLVPQGEEDYPREDFHLVKKQKAFDALVDPTQGIRRVIESMVRQPITIFNSKGQPEVKDALYYNGYWYGKDKRDNDLGAPFREGYFKKPKLVFAYSDPSNPYDPKSGERRGTYKTSGNTLEHYIFLSEDKKERRKQLEDILQKATGTFTANLKRGGHLSYRIPDPSNNHSGTHGEGFTWDVFCDLSLDELGELQNKGYYTEKSTGYLKDATGTRVSYDPSTKKVETARDR